MAPIAPRVQVADVQTVAHADIDFGYGAAYLSSDESASPSWGLVVEQYTAVVG